MHRWADIAQEKAREWFREREQESAGNGAEDKGPYTVRQATFDYLDWFRGEKKSIRETEYVVPRECRLPGVKRKWISGDWRSACSQKERAPGQAGKG